MANQEIIQLVVLNVFAGSIAILLQCRFPPEWTHHTRSYVAGPLLTLAIVLVIGIAIVVCYELYSGGSLNQALRVGLGSLVLLGPGAIVFSSPGAFVGSLLGTRLRWRLQYQAYHRGGD